MSDDQPEDDFGLPDSDEDDGSNNYEPEDGFPQDSNEGEDQNRDEENKDMSDENGLPEGWRPNGIPNESDFNHAGVRRLRELRQDLNNTDDPQKIDHLLEKLKDTIRLTQWLPKLVSHVVETGLAMRSPAQKIGRLDIWEDVIFLMFDTIHDQLKTIEERSEHFKRIFASLSDFKANTGSKFPTESVLRELASEYGMDDAEQSGWLPAQAAFLNAVILDYPLEVAEAMADELIQLARNEHDQTTEMRAYISKSRLYINENDNASAFTLAQQALAIAVQINSERFYSDILANMISCALTEHRTEFVEALFAYWHRLRPHLKESIHENALFCRQRGKFYFDHKMDYQSAAEAFQEGYECEKTQQKAVAQATCLLGVGMSMTKLGDYLAAQDYYEHALNIHKREGNGEMEIWIRHAMGWNAKESGDVEMGILHLDNALERALDLPVTTRLITICKGIKEDLDAYRSSLK